MGEFKTKVSLARPDSTSLRTTIPEGIAQLIDLKAGDEITWKLDIKDSKVSITVGKS